MWFPPRETIAESNESTAFLALAWNEMFDPLTPDSYQPRLSNTFSLLSDLHRAARMLEENPKSQKEFTVLKAELSEVVEQEKDILNSLPFLRSTTRTYLTRSAKDLIPLFPTLKTEQEEYCRKIELGLIEASRGLPEKKEQALRAVRRLATLALQDGRTAEEMRALADEAHLGQSPEDFANHLITGIKPVEDTMRCILAVVGQVPDVKSICRKVGFNVVPEHEFQEGLAKEFHDSVVSELVPQNSDDEVLLIEKTLTSSSRRKAAKDAVRDLRDSIDIFNFYSECSAIRTSDEALVKKGGEEFVRTRIANYELRQRRPRRPRQLTIKTLDTVPLENLNGRILNALEHYRLAHSSSALRVKLVNLWTGLECLAGASDSIIDQVCELVAPIVAWRRSDKLLTYAASCLQQHRLGNEHALPASLTPRTDAVSRENLLLLLAKPEGEPGLRQLSDFAQDHPLLRNRLFVLRKTFSEPKTLRSELLLSHSRVVWFLHRIYASRNLIIHQGSDNDTLQPLLDALHYYFSLTLSRILHGMQLRPNFSLDETIAYWQARFAHLMLALEEDPRSLRVYDFFPTPFKADSNKPVWT
jgi:hypothetical protein